MEVMGDWRKLHYELHNLYFSQNIIGMVISQIKTGRACSKNGTIRNLVRRPDRNRPLGSPRHRWKNVIMTLKV